MHLALAGIADPMIRPGRAHPRVALETAPQLGWLGPQREALGFSHGLHKRTVVPGRHHSHSKEIMSRAHHALMPLARPALSLRLGLPDLPLPLALVAAIRAPGFLLAAFLVTVQHPPTVLRFADHDLQPETQVFGDPLVEL